MIDEQSGLFGRFWGRYGGLGTAAWILVASTVIGLTSWAIFFWPSNSYAWHEAMSTTIRTWLASIGGAAALLAIFVTNVRTRQVEQTAIAIAGVQDIASRPPAARVVWDVDPTPRKGRSRIVNRGTRRADNVVVVDLTREKDGRSGLVVQRDLPDSVEINDSIPIAMDRTFADQLISRIKISWTEEGEPVEAFYSIT